MRILHTTDLHFRPAWFDWIARQSAHFDVVCISGDLLDMSPSASMDLHGQARWVSDWLDKFPGKMVATCSGNHDTWFDESEDPDADGRWLIRSRRRGVAVDGDVKIVGGMRFVCTPWLQPVDVAGFEPVVLLAHAPPEGTAVARSRGENDLGDFEIARIVHELPRGSLVLSGHVHRPEKWYARVENVYCFNPGVTFKNPSTPDHVVIDTVQRSAEWWGAGRKRAKLRLAH